MSFTVTVQPSAKSFSAEPDQTILEAALAAGIVIPYGCKNGACGSCKGKVVSGEIAQGPHQASSLSAAEQAEGKALFCCAKACSNLEIEARVIQTAGDFPLKKLPCRVASVERAADDVVILKLQLPATERLQYLAGQYVEIILRDGTRRSYSMAGAPGVSEHLELHLRHLPGGKFTDAVFGVSGPATKEKDIMRFEGPMGTFFLREDSTKPMVMIASGTGFAPIKALMELIQAKGIARPITLYWGGRRPKDLYLNALCEEWATRLPFFTYVPVVSDAIAEDAWTGRTGFVHKAVVADFPDLSGHQVYACGAPIVIESAQRELIAQCSLPEDEFYADSFISEADIARQAS
jgi:CDP-4-dehydro-6-deoxyglucose reductase, E3